MPSLKMFLSICFLQILIPAVFGATSCNARNTESEDTRFTDYAICTMMGDLYGSVYIREGLNNGIEFRYKLGGLSPGLSHETHVHEWGNLFINKVTDLCHGTGSMYNPANAPKDGTGANRPIGNLGEICADEDGLVDEVFVDNLTSLSGANSILGRSIVVHVSAHDDHDGHDGHDSHAHGSGDAHDNLGCCVIGLANTWVPEDLEVGISYEANSGTNKKQPSWVFFASFVFLWKHVQ